MLLLLFLFTFVNPFPQINLFYIFAKPHKIISMMCTILLCFIQENEIFLICVIFITVKAVNYYLPSGGAILHGVLIRLDLTGNYLFLI